MRLRGNSEAYARLSSSFNSRTLGRVRLNLHSFQGLNVLVSIHAPWEGCDVVGVAGCAVVAVVSIHAPWEGCDPYDKRTTRSSACFNSRTLGRVRLVVGLLLLCCSSFNSRTLGRVRPRRGLCHLSTLLFQFTHPGKGATYLIEAYEIGDAVSIHAPWEGCDIERNSNSKATTTFQFTHPGKGATGAIA